MYTYISDNFWRTHEMINEFQGENRFLSNFWISPIEFINSHGEPMSAMSVEHAYQACKALNPEDCKMILDASTPGKAKRLAQNITLIPVWEEIKIDVMSKLLELKFERGSLLASSLIQTHPEFLVEGNKWGDIFWGVCEGRGYNWLGFLLMGIRQELHKEVLQ